jgi:L-aminopeptidase/D-esterase-like protein
MAGNSSGDFCLAFSTANAGAASPSARIAHVRMLQNEELSSLFAATVLATEEAIVNALVAAETMTGADGFTVDALPHDELRSVLARYHRPAI